MLVEDQNVSEATTRMLTSCLGSCFISSADMGGGGGGGGVRDVLHH